MTATSKSLLEQFEELSPEDKRKARGLGTGVLGGLTLFAGYVFNIGPFTSSVVAGTAMTLVNITLSPLERWKQAKWETLGYALSLAAIGIIGSTATSPSSAAKSLGFSQINATAPAGHVPQAPKARAPQPH